MEIIMPRGDLRNISFCIKDSNDDIVTTDFNEIYITFKEDYIDERVLFQKRLTAGNITKDSESNYHFTLFPEDTDWLKYQDYVFDIELYSFEENEGIKTPILKQTTLGKLTLTNEATFAINEGD